MESPHSPSLNTVQRWFSAVITHPDGVEKGLTAEEAQSLVTLGRGELERMITRSEQLSARDRLSIYAHAYYARLIECLADSFPVLKRTLGEELFNGFAFSYLQSYPSRSYTLNKLGEKFAQYLNETRPDRSEKSAPGDNSRTGWPDFLIDLVTLERTIEEVFDGPGTEGGTSLKVDRLLALTPEKWPQLKLRINPSMRLLRFRFPVNSYYSTARMASEADVLTPPEPEESYLAIFRRDFVVRRLPLDKPQYSLLQSLQMGGTLDAAVQSAASSCAWDDRDLAMRLGEWFKSWSQNKIFTEYTV